jgi:hypothetical protein
MQDRQNATGRPINVYIRLTSGIGQRVDGRLVTVRRLGRRRRYQPIYRPLYVGHGCTFYHDHGRSGERTRVDPETV